MKTNYHVLQKFLKILKIKKKLNSLKDNNSFIKYKIKIKK